MKKFTTQEIGSLRKPRWLVDILKNKNISLEEKEKAREDAALINIKLLEDVGLDVIYDGEARRVEMYEYSVKRIDGMKAAGRVRSWDNKYYNKSRCVNKVKYTGPYHLEEFNFIKEHTDGIIKLPITGAYTLADWSYNEYYKSKHDLAIAFARNVIRPLVRDLVRNGAKFIQIDEPAATTHPNEIAMMVESFNESIKGINCKFGIHICYSSDYSGLFPEILEAKNQQYTLEFANRDTMKLGRNKTNRQGYNVLKTFKEYGEKKEIGLGVVDVHINEVESPELIKDRIVYASKLLDNPKLIHVNPDCGLRTRTREISFAKLKNMVIGAKLASKEI